MALPPIKVQVAFGGLNEVLGSLKTIEQAQERVASTAVSKKQASINAQIKLEEAKTAKLKQLGENEVNAEKAKADRIVSIEEAKAKRINSINQSQHDNNLRAEQKHTSQLHSEWSRRLNLFASFAQRLGLPNVAGFSRIAAQSTNVGIGGGSGGSEGGIGASGASAVAGGAALATAILAGFVIKKTFDVLVDGIKFGVDEFASAILEIGGGFKISSALVQGARNETAITRATLAAGGNPADTMNMVKSLSSGSSFSREEWTKAIKAQQDITGKLMTEDQGQFIGKMALTTGAPLDQVSQIYGMVTKMQPNLSGDDTQAVVRKLQALAAQGSISIEDIPKLAPSVGMAASMSGGLQNDRNLSTVLGTENLIRPFVKDVGGAQTLEKALFNGLQQLKVDPKKLAQYEAEGGKGISKTIDKYTGKQIVNFDDRQILENILLMQNHGENTKKIFGLQRSQEAIRDIGTGLGLAGKTPEEQKAIMDTYFDSQDKAQLSMEKLNDNFKTLNDLLEIKTKTALNQMTNTIQDSLMPALGKIVDGPLKDLSEELKNNSDSIAIVGDAFVDLIEGFEKVLVDVIPAIHAFGVVLGLGSHAIMAAIRIWIDTMPFGKLLAEQLGLNKAMFDADEITDRLEGDFKKIMDKIQDRIDNPEFYKKQPAAPAAPTVDPIASGLGPIDVNSAEGKRKIKEKLGIVESTAPVTANGTRDYSGFDRDAKRDADLAKQIQLAEAQLAELQEANKKKSVAPNQSPANWHAPMSLPTDGNPAISR